MATSNRIVTAALFAEKVLAACQQVRGINANMDSPGEELKNAFRKAKISYLSHGHYGAVLPIPGTEDVLKVCAAATDGYPAYALWAQLNPGPGIPEIFYAQRIDEDFFVCAMPKYTALTADDKERAEKLRNQGENCSDPASYLGKAVKAVMKALGKVARKDMHMGNFMYCSRRGEYIITDPFAELFMGQDEAEGWATGRDVTPPIKDQVELNFDVPPAAPDYKGHSVTNTVTLQDVAGQAPNVVHAAIEQMAAGMGRNIKWPSIPLEEIARMREYYERKARTYRTSLRMAG